MSESVYFVFSLPPDEIGIEEFSRWYEGHVHDILRVDGFAAARRFTPLTAVNGETSPTMYAHLSLYAIDGPPQEAMARLAEATQTGVVPIPDWFGRARFASFYGSPLEGSIELAKLDHAYLVFSTPPASMSDEDYIEWYWTHARENLTADGFDAVWRYHLEADRTDPVAPCDAVHAALYEVHGELPALRAALREAAAAGRVGFPEWFGDIKFASLDCVAASAPIVALAA